MTMKIDIVNNTTRDDAPRKSLWDTIKACSGTELDRRNPYRFTAWTFAWTLSYVAASWVLKADLDLATPLVWLLAAAPNVIAVVAVFAYLRFLRMADELMRRIQLEGLAIGFGCGVFFAAGYPLFERAGAPPVDSNDLLMVMMLGWVGGQLYSMGRYR